MAKKLSNCDCLIAVMSGNFCQRGDLSIIDKFTKTELALRNGVDIIVELPYLYATQSATQFAKGAIATLELFGINSLVFGSETNNLEELSEIASLEVNPDHFKEMIDTGISYPKAYGLLAKAFLPNDILAISYLKALKGTTINPISIVRTTPYHSSELGPIASAKAIREAVLENRDYHEATPAVIDHPVFIDDLYPYLRRLLLSMSREDLQKIHLISEGIEKILIDNAASAATFKEFVDRSTSKRYTASRIKRITLQIMNMIKKEDLERIRKTTYARVLGFNSCGQAVIRELRQQQVPIETQFKRLPKAMREIEFKSTLLYASLFDEEHRQKLIRQELAGPIIIDK